jgi:hypothetical protein
MGLKFDLVTSRDFSAMRPHNETLSVAAMSVGNPDCSPLGINRCNTAPTPTGFAELVSD